MDDIYRREEAEKLELNDAGLTAARHAAEVSFEEGGEEDDQLIAGIKAYLYVVREVIRAEYSPKSLEKLFDEHEASLLKKAQADGKE